MKIAVTGSSGFIGSSLVPSLSDLGFYVLEISRKAGLNICDWDSVRDLPKCDIIIHLAAKTFVPNSFENPRDFYHINQSATLNALDLARVWNAKLIYMSSYFYGDPEYLPVDEGHPLMPHNPYAQSKLLSELLCEGYHRDFKVPVVIFRLFNIYGPGQSGSFLIPSILDQIKSGEIILKDPRPKRDYIHINDVIRAIIAGIEYDESGYNIFNLGTGISYSVEELVHYVKKYSNPVPKVIYTNEIRKGEILESIADISLAKEKLNWFPNITIEDGIKGLIT